MAAKIRLTALVVLVGGLMLAGLSSPLGPPMALAGALGLTVQLAHCLWTAFVRPIH